MSTPSIRRLAAILIADVVGYSRMMERDEPGTHGRVARIRAEVTDPAVRRHGGRIVRSVGDGFLVEFPSAVSALEAAIEIQRTMTDRNHGLPQHARIDHRIGINLGDILVDEHDIAGTGVNVAARLEALAPPGGITVSAAVREQVRQDLGIRFIDGGAHRVKNISQPVRVFHVALDGAAPQAAPARTGRGRRWAAAAALVLLAIFAGSWFAARTGTQDAAPQTLAVLPFDHPAQPAGADAFAASLAQQLTSAVSQLTGVTVIAPAVAAPYAAFRGDIRRIGRELAVRYALDGRIDWDDDLVRVAVHVVDTASGGSLWSGSVQAPAAADGAVPLALVGQLADALRAAVRSAELKRVDKGKDGESAYAIALGAIDALERSTDGAELPAIRARFERALALDPGHVPALTGYAHALVYLADQTDSAADGAALLRRADEASLRAVTLRPDSAEAWAARGNVLYFRDQYDAAAEAVRRGLQLNPYLVMLHAFDGEIQLVQDRAAAALAALDRGIELNPTGPLQGVLMHLRARALLALGRFDEAARSCERGIAFGAEWYDYMLLTAAHALRGDAERAAQARAELLRMKPEFSIGSHRRLLSSRSTGTQYVRTLHAGLRQAGVPE
jgi:class 3 adenylate cyclase/TolB-like protein